MVQESDVLYTLLWMVNSSFQFTKAGMHIESVFACA